MVADRELLSCCRKDIRKRRRLLWGKFLTPHS